MPTQRARVARVDKRELADVPPAWTEPERGQYLRLLLRGKGIDPDRLFRVEYHPRRHCWLVIQDPPTSGACRLSQPGHCAADAALYREAMNLFRRTAQAAFAALAAQSSHFASFGRDYQLPPRQQETSISDLVHQLGGPVAEEPAVYFDAEGGWQNPPSEN